ncbi:MAG: hypothetical protein U0169_20705 [Polyangiaceae bacterium]
MRFGTSAARIVGVHATLGFAIATSACRGSSSDPPDPTAAVESPQAKVDPAPLTDLPVVPSSPRPPTGPDAGPPPTNLYRDKPVPPDVIAKDPVVVSLVFALRPSDVAGPSKAPEVNVAAIDALRKRVEARFVIDLGGGRMRLVLEGKGHTLPPGAEIRARVDRYGHVLVLPNEESYRVVPPLAFRTVMEERRVDVTPLSPVDVTSPGEGPRRLGTKTRKIDVTTRAARMALDVAKVVDVGESGALLCRTLFDLVGASPSSVPCAPDEVPLHVDVRWANGGTLTIEATSMVRRTDVQASLLATPPVSARFTESPFGGGADTLLAASDLAPLRTGPQDVPSAPPGAPTIADGALVLGNASNELRTVWLDGVPVAYVAPGAWTRVTGLDRGRYTLQWRTYWSDGTPRTETTLVPGTAVFGAGDAGPP